MKSMVSLHHNKMSLDRITSLESARTGVYTKKNKWMAFVIKLTKI